MLKRLLLIGGALAVLVGFAAPSLADSAPQPAPEPDLPAEVVALLDAAAAFFDLADDDREVLARMLATILDADDDESELDVILTDEVVERAEQTLGAPPEQIEEILEETRRVREERAIATALKLNELGIADDGTPLNDLLDEHDVDFDDFLHAVDDLIDRYENAQPAPEDPTTGGCVADCHRPRVTIPPSCQDLSTETFDACLNEAVDALPDGALDDLGECDPWNPATWNVCVETQLPGGFDALPPGCDLSNITVAIDCIEQLEPGGIVPEPADPPAPPPTTIPPAPTTTQPERPTEEPS